MATIKTAELTGAALDWAVAHADIFTEWWAAENPRDGLFLDHARTARYSPSTDWSQGGPIIESVKLDLHSIGGAWSAFVYEHKWHSQFSEQYGPTALIAAMRCFVASKLGDTVEVPDELL